MRYRTDSQMDLAYSSAFVLNGNTTSAGWSEKKSGPQDRRLPQLAAPLSSDANRHALASTEATLSASCSVATIFNIGQRPDQVHTTKIGVHTRHVS